MPIEIGEVTVAAGNNKIYAIGGTTADRVDHQLNHEYDIATDRWRARASLARGMTHTAAVGEPMSWWCLICRERFGKMRFPMVTASYRPSAESECMQEIKRC